MSVRIARQHSKTNLPHPTNRATVEVNDSEKVVKRAVELLLELRVLKKEKELDYAFCSVVDLQERTTTLLLCGLGEELLAKAAFPDGKYRDATEFGDVAAEAVAGAGAEGARMWVWLEWCWMGGTIDGSALF